MTTNREDTSATNKRTSTRSGSGTRSSTASTSTSNSTSASTPGSHSATQVNTTARQSKKVLAQASTAKTTTKAKTKNKTARDDEDILLPTQKKRKMSPDTSIILDVDEHEEVEEQEQPSYAEMKRNVFCESLGSDTVIVKIGKDEAPFTLYKSRLSLASDFFKKAFDGGFREAEDMEMKIDDVNIHVFESFVEWLYHGRITLPEDDNQSLDLLIDTYLFGDRILCTGLKNGVMDHIQDVMWRTPGCNCCRPQIYLSTSNVEKIFENTAAKDSPIRKYCAALGSYALFLERGLDEVEDYFKVPGFLKEVSLLLSTMRHDINDWEERYGDGPVPMDDPRGRGVRRIRDTEGDPTMVGYDICFFHVHAPGDEKCTSKRNFTPIFYPDDSDFED